uniref:Memo-like protein, putative n=1 Tax=Theileria annulata TaxID=5874 RepID=A0A3B0NH10_THEAN
MLGVGTLIHLVLWNLKLSLQFKGYQIHAGYAYSLKTAAHAYSQIDATSIKTIFVLGPSHHFFLRGCAVDRFSSLQTPLGVLQVDVDIVEKLSDLKGFSVINNEASEDEHSIEMHLPLLKFVFKKEHVKVVPIMVGEFSESLADELMPYFNDENTLFVISSDFCHFGSRYLIFYIKFFRFQFSITGYESENKPLYEKIEMLDKRGIDLILLAASNLNISSKLLHYSQVLNNQLENFNLVIKDYKGFRLLSVIRLNSWIGP